MIMDGLQENQTWNKTIRQENRSFAGKVKAASSTS